MKRRRQRQRQQQQRQRSKSIARHFAPARDITTVISMESVSALEYPFFCANVNAAMREYAMTNVWIPNATTSQLLDAWTIILRQLNTLQPPASTAFFEHNYFRVDLQMSALQFGRTCRAARALVRRESAKFLPCANAGCVNPVGDVAQVCTCRTMFCTNCALIPANSPECVRLSCTTCGLESCVYTCDKLICSLCKEIRRCGGCNLDDTWKVCSICAYAHCCSPPCIRKSPTFIECDRCGDTCCDVCSLFFKDESEEKKVCFECFNQVMRNKSQSDTDTSSDDDDKKYVSIPNATMSQLLDAWTVIIRQPTALELSLDTIEGFSFRVNIQKTVLQFGRTCRASRALVRRESAKLPCANACCVNPVGDISAGSSQVCTCGLMFCANCALNTEIIKPARLLLLTMTKCGPIACNYCRYLMSYHCVKYGNARVPRMLPEQRVE